MVQLESENSASGDHIDEHYVYVKGDFGKVIEIGGENALAKHDSFCAQKSLVGKLTIITSIPGKIR